MRRGFTKVDFNSHELSDKAWTVYIQEDTRNNPWVKKLVYDDEDNEHYEYYQWYDRGEHYEHIGTIEDVNEYFESLLDEYPELYSSI